MQPDIIREVQCLLGDGEGNLTVALPACIHQLIKQRAWESALARGGEPFTSFEHFVTHKLPQGLESTISDLLHYCRKDPDIQTEIRAEISAANEKGSNQHTVAVGNTRTTNNTQESKIRRLKRDHPELAQQVIEGALSAHAAAVQAGFRRATKSIPIDTPENAVKALLRVFTREQIRSAIEK